MEIDILVGANHIGDFVTGRSKRTDDGLMAIHTKLGWVLNGPVNNEALQKHSVNLTSATHVLKIEVGEVPLKAQLEKFWEVENYGQSEPETLDDPKSFIDKIEFDGERYSVPLPWKPGMQKKLQDNLYQSEKRLMAQLNRLKDDPENLKRYDDVMKEWASEGIIERCDDYPHKANVIIYRRTVS